MDIKTLADLGKIADLCRKKGIESIKIADGTVEFKLAHGFERRRRGTRDTSNPEVDTPFSEEDALFWSSAGLPMGEN